MGDYKHPYSVFKGNLGILFKTLFMITLNTPHCESRPYQKDRNQSENLHDGSYNKTPLLTISCASSSCLHWTCSTNGSNLNTASPLDWARADIWRTNRALLIATRTLLEETPPVQKSVSPHQVIWCTFLMGYKQPNTILLLDVTSFWSLERRRQDRKEVW